MCYIIKKKLKGSNKSNKVFNKSAKVLARRIKLEKKFRNNGFVIFDE